MQNNSSSSSSTGSKRRGRKETSRSTEPKNSKEFNALLKSQELSASPALRKRKKVAEQEEEDSSDEEVTFINVKKRSKMASSDEMEYADNTDDIAGGSDRGFSVAFFTKYMEDNVTSKIGALGEQMSGLANKVNANGSKLVALERRVWQLEGGQPGPSPVALGHHPH